MTTAQLPGQVFNDVADRYDRARPGYPPEVLGRALELAGISRPSSVLEIGCGTGQLTIPLALAGHDVLALDPGDEMGAAVLRKCIGLDVAFQCSTFEAWPARGRHFDLVASAQAFHWVDPKIGGPKAVACTKPGGAIVLLWHVNASHDSAFEQAVKGIIDRSTSRSSARNGRGLRRKAKELRGMFAGIPGVEIAGDILHRWDRRFSALEFMNFFTTASTFLDNPEPVRTRIYEEVLAEVDRVGGIVERVYETVGFVARRAP